MISSEEEVGERGKAIARGGEGREEVPGESTTQEITSF